MFPASDRTTVERDKDDKDGDEEDDEIDDDVGNQDLEYVWIDGRILSCRQLSDDSLSLGFGTR